jgi:hypothetical protein
MAMKEYTLSDAATRALSTILLDEDFAAGAPSVMLDDVLAYLSELTGLSEEEARLNWELEAMPDKARHSMSCAIAAARARVHESGHRGMAG